MATIHPFPRSGTPATAAAPLGRWAVTPAPPAEWTQALAACGGTFFHAPPALEVSLPPGEPVYARLVQGSRTVAVALGVAARCRLARSARHYRFATLPAAAPGVDRDLAAAQLAELLGARGAAEVVMESFGAAARAEPGEAGAAGRERIEFVVPLDCTPEEMLMRMRPTHRRHARRGEQSGWRMRVLRGDDALRLLHAVRAGASERAAARGGGFDAGQAEQAFGRAAERTAPWGTATFAAYDGEAPLCAAGVGWAGGCSYFLTGGSTPEGYRRSAAHWLKWRIMSELAAAGLTHHNLGGVPAEARVRDHPAHGLYEYKSGYGGDEVPCRGARWEPDAAHLRLHAVLARLAGGGR